MTLPQMISRQVFHDPTPGAMVNNRIFNGLFLMSQELNLSDDQKSGLLTVLQYLCIKIVIVWKHYDRFLSLQNQLAQETPVLDLDAKPQFIQLKHSQDLFMEFDEFLVQYKSSLDHLAKVPSPLLGYNKWNPSSFGDKGERIISMLKNALPKPSKFLAKAYQEAIHDKYKDDLATVIDARDRITHFIKGGIKFESFTVQRVKQDGKETLHVPMWSQDQSTSDFMKVVWHNHLKFCEHFIAFFLSMYLHPEQVLYSEPCPPDAVKSPFKIIPRWVMEERLKKTPADKEWLRPKEES